MALIDVTAAEAIARTLAGGANTQVDPKIWSELSRVHADLKQLANLIDLVNNPGTSNYAGVPVNMHLQEQTRVTARAGQAIGKYRPVRFELSGGELTAFWPGYKSGTSLIETRADAVAGADVATGALGEFILRGIAVAAVNALSAADLASKLDADKGRLFAVGNPDATDAAVQHYFNPTASNPGSAAGRDFAYAGVFLHNYASGTVLSTCLMYFNPERHWADRVYS